MQPIGGAGVRCNKSRGDDVIVENLMFGTAACDWRDSGGRMGCSCPALVNSYCTSHPRGYPETMEEEGFHQYTRV